MTCLNFQSLSGSSVNRTPLVSPISSWNHKKGPGHISTCKNLSRSSKISHEKEKDKT